MPLVIAPSFFSAGLAVLLSAKPIKAPYPRKIIKIPERCKKLYTLGAIIALFLQKLRDKQVLSCLPLLVIGGNNYELILGM